MENQAEANAKMALPLFGMAEKPYFDMTAEERVDAHLAALNRAREAAFTRGLPIVYAINGVVVAEYANGRKFVRANGKDIALYHEN